MIYERNLLIDLNVHVLHKDEFVRLLKPVDAPLDGRWNERCSEESTHRLQSVGLQCGSPVEIGGNSNANTLRTSNPES